MSSGPSVSSPAVDPQHPWLGLASFTEETRAYFHGREEEIGELGRRVQRKLLTILFGQSGLGKTSILRAGLVPRLRPEGYCPVYVRIDYSADSPAPAEQIKQAILRTTRDAGHWTQPGVSQGGETLWEFLHHRDDVLRDAGGRTLIPLLIFDQFEEIFTLAQGDDAGRQRAARFLEDLADLVENRAPRALEEKLERDEAGMERFDFSRADYRILIALREDYLAHLEGLKAQMPSVTQNRMRLARMTGPQALAAVTGPGRALVTDDVAAAIVRFIAGAADLARAEVEPSLLSLVCRELNNTRLTQGRAEISADLLAGSRDTILSEFYERTLADQPPGVRTFIEDELLTDSGYRESIAEERVKKGLVAAGASAAALATLVDRRLLRVEERLDVRRVEFTHDVLCGVVKASRDVRQEREARAAEERRRQETETQLASARAEEAAAKRAVVRARMIATGCVALAVVALGAALWGWVNLRRAEAAEDVVSLERDRAQQARAEAERLVSFLLDDLHTQLEPTGRIEIVSGLAKRALAYFDALPKEFRDDRSERYRAIALSRFGFALAQQGKTLEAEIPLQDAEQIFTRLRAAGDGSFETALGLTAVLRQQSRNSYMQNRAAAAVALARRGTKLVADVAAAAGAPGSARLEQGRTLMNLGFVLMRDNQTAEALATLDQARGILRRLMDEPAERQRARVIYAENAAWLHEAARSLSRGAETAELTREAVRIATEAVQQEAGNLGALRSRALLRSRLAQDALDQYDYVGAERLAKDTAADWSEFLRFDPQNDTAHNNRRAVLGVAGEALWRQGRFDEVIEINRGNAKEALARGGSPSTLRGTAFQSLRTDGLAAELGRISDVDAAMADSRKLREMALSQVEPENYYRQVNQSWDEGWQSTYLLSLGRTEDALALARSAVEKLNRSKPVTGSEVRSHRAVQRALLETQVTAYLRLGRWPEAARAARVLLQGRPALDDTSPGTLDELASDRALAAVALTRDGAREEARALLAQATEFNRGRRTAGANDHESRSQSAGIALARGLLAEDPVAQRAAFSAGLAEISAMEPQPQQMRYIRELRAVLEAELARVGR